MHCIMANILQTSNVDTECDKLATELSWQLKIGDFCRKALST